MKWQRLRRRAFRRVNPADSRVYGLQAHSTPPLFDLLRHGRTETPDIFRGQIEDPLSERGWQQMTEAVEGRRWDEIVCSPLERCRLFATDLAERLGIELEQDWRFAEYHFGDWDGKPYAEIMQHQSALVEQFFADPFSCTPPNAERFADFHDRVTEAWQQRLQTSTGKSVLIVTHGGVIMSVLAEVMGLQVIHGKIDVGYANLTRIRPGSDGMPHRLVSHTAPTEE